MTQRHLSKPEPPRTLDPELPDPALAWQAHAREIERVKRKAAEDQATITKALQEQVTVLQAQTQQLQLDNARMSAAGVSSKSELARAQLEREVQRAQLASSQQFHDKILEEQLAARLDQAKASVKSEVDEARSEAERANQLAVEALEASQEMARENHAMRQSELTTPLVPLRRGSPTRRALSPVRPPERGSPVRTTLPGGALARHPTPQGGPWDPIAQDMIAQLQKQLLQQSQMLQDLQAERKEPTTAATDDGVDAPHRARSPRRSRDIALEHALERAEQRGRELEMQLTYGMQYTGELERELEARGP